MKLLRWRPALSAETFQESNWKEVRAARDWMNEEFMEIQAEANKLIDGWGAHIIGHAVHKYDEITQQRRAHQMAQREKMMKAKREKAAESMRKHEKEIERQQRRKREIAANKMAERIIREEQASSSKDSPKEGTLNGRILAPPWYRKVEHGFL